MNVRELFDSDEFDVYVDNYGSVNIEAGPIHVWITARPHYCDRGRWQVNAESTDPTRLSIDWADGFPRYYFHTEALAMEINTWLQTRLKDIPAKSKAEIEHDAR